MSERKAKKFELGDPWEMWHDELRIKFERLNTGFTFSWFVDKEKVKIQIRIRKCEREMDNHLNQIEEIRTRISVCEIEMTNCFNQTEVIQIRIGECEKELNNPSNQTEEFQTLIKEREKERDDLFIEIEEIQIRYNKSEQDRSEFMNEIESTERTMRGIERIIDANEKKLIFIEDLLKKLDTHPKGTTALNANERFEYLIELGLFETPKWKEIHRNATADEKEKLVAEILQCSKDVGRHLLNRNSKYLVSEKKRNVIQERIKNLNKGV